MSCSAVPALSFEVLLSGVFEESQSWTAVPCVLFVCQRQLGELLLVLCGCSAPFTSMRLRRQVGLVGSLMY